SGACGLVLGFEGSRCTLAIRDGGCVVVPKMFVGLQDFFAVPSVGNQITIAGGSLIVTNAYALYGAGLLQLTHGTLTLDHGTLTTDTLKMGQTLASHFVFNSGLLNCRSTFVYTGEEFIVGNGVDSATFHLLGGEHSFNNGLRIRAHSFLTGCGRIN